MRKRKSKNKRVTKETNISWDLNIDGQGKNNIKTGIGFLDHMLTLFAFHGLFDLNVNVKKGDLEVDIHHTNEDVAICLGKAFKDALGDCKGIKRFGSKEVPMDTASAKVTVDIGGRYAFVFNPPSGSAPSELQSEGQRAYSYEDGKDFLDTFAKNVNMNLHVEIYSGKDLHHVLEAIFKALGIAMDEATQIDIRRTGIPSTKGII